MATNEQQKPIIKLVENFGRKRDLSRTSGGSEIDDLVYELYGLGGRDQNCGWGEDVTNKRKSAQANKRCRDNLEISTEGGS